MQNKEISEILLGLKRAVKLISRTEKRSLLVASFLMFFAGILTNLPAVVLGKLVDKLTITENFKFETALFFIGLIVFIILVREILTVIRKYLVENTVTQTEKKQTINLISHLLKANISFLNSQQIGSLNGKVFRSIQGLVQIIKLAFLEFLPTVFSATAAIFIALFQKPSIAVIMILVVPTGLFIIFKQISSQKGIRTLLLRAKEKIDGVVVEILSGMETVRSLNTEDQEITKIESITEDIRKKEIKHHFQMALFDSAKYLNEGFFYVLVISLSIYFSTQGLITRGDILVYSILFASIIGPLREIHRIIDQAHESSILVNDLIGLLEEPIDRSFKPSFVEVGISKVKSDLVLQTNNLTFAYSHDSNKILDNLNLNINYGEKIGIVGASGSGKSTLIKILLRLVHDYDGKIYFLGKDLMGASREEIANKIAYIPQKTYIFSGTIRENITYGNYKENIKNTEVINATKQANIYDEIVRHLGGFDGKVNENGNNLSGGQKQRIVLARIILRSPDILIFDEATSALDNTNEAIVQKNIERIFKDKTIITIAHRLTTLKNCSRIIVFEKGKIIQEGQFDELSKEEGLFRTFLKQVYTT